MARFMAVVVGPLVFAVAVLAQNSPSNTSTSDPQAITIARKSLLAMTGGAPVTDATLTGAVRWIAGSDDETGTGTFFAKGTNESRVDLELDGETESEIRTSSQGIPSGQWKRGDNSVQTSAQQNCWTDAAWFFPPLSSLTQIANPTFVFSYLGQTQHDGLALLHLRVTQILPGDTPKLNLSRLSAMDFYLDPNSFLPLAVSFQVHSNSDMNQNIPVEIRFANYQAVNGINVPFHIQKLLNGSLLMDVVLNGASINSGLTDERFTLQ